MFDNTEGGGLRASKSTRPLAQGAHVLGVTGAETGIENKKADMNEKLLHRGP